MAGLGLSDAVTRFQQGMAWRERQDELNAQKAANQAGTDVIEEGRKKWAADGNTGAYRPDDATMFRASEARGQAFAKAGNWRGFMENEAQVSPMRMRARVNALQRFEQDGDFDKLIRATYATVPDGVGVEKVERLDGVDSDLAGAPRGATKIRVTTSDGRVRIMEPDAVLGMVKKSLVDPVEAAQMEAKINAARAKKKFDSDEDIRVDNAKQGNRKEIVGMQGDNARKLQTQRAADQVGLAGVNNAAAKERTIISANASMSNAKTRTSGGGGAKRVQSRTTNSAGQVVLHFADGTSDLAKIDGQPVRSSEWGKRVDSLVKTYREDRRFRGKSETDIRRAAEAQLAGTPEEEDNEQPAATNPADPSDLSYLWKN